MADHQTHPGPTAEEYGVELERVSRDLEGVEDALRRLDDGTYGRCRICGGDIAAQHLQSDPLATACAAHAAPAA